MAHVARFIAVCSIVAASFVLIDISPGPAGASSPEVTATSSAEEATITAASGTDITLIPIDGTPTTNPSGTVGGAGTLEFDPLEAGLYEIWADTGSGSMYAGTVAVLDDRGQQDLIAQSEPMENELHRFGYVEVGTGPTRTLLSFDLQFPEAASSGLPAPVGTCTTGCSHLPALLEYSVYDASNPDVGDRENALDSAPEVDRGYAALAVNTRGTGCSGGVLEDLPVNAQQGEDGHDVVETLAAQTWSNERVGMVGTSAPGIEQLNVAATNPPHLVAITPAAVTGRPYDNGYPGGIPSRHFDWWSSLVQLLSAPAGMSDADRQQILTDTYGYQRWSNGREDKTRSWIHERAEDGDHICEANADAHEGNSVPRDTIDAHPTYDSLWAGVNLRKMLHDTTVPTLLIEGLNDDFAPLGFDALLDPNDPVGGTAASPGPKGDPLDSEGHQNPLIRVVTGSGGHDLSESPEAMTERDAFLDLLVAQRAVPTTSAGGAARVRPSDASTTCLPPYLSSATTVLSGQRAALYSADPIVVYWDQTFGQAGSLPGTPPDWPRVGLDDACNGARFQSTADEWPPVAATPRTLAFGADGTLDAASPAGGSVDFDATARFSTWESVGRPRPSRPRPGQVAEFTSAPLTDTQPYLGPASVDLSLTSNQPIVDLEATISEVGADGTETLVRSGWRRTSVPLQTGATALQPRLDTSSVGCSGDPLAGAACLSSTPKAVRIPISSFAHTFHAGSRIRVRISGPGYSEVGMPFLTTPTRAPAAHTGAHVSVVVPTSGSTVGLVMSPAPALPSAIGSDPGIATPATCGTVSNVVCFQPVVATVQHPFDANGHAVLHLDWVPNTAGSQVAGYHVYLDDHVAPDADIPVSGYPGTFGVPALPSSTDLDISVGHVPTLVRVMPYVVNDSIKTDVEEMETRDITVPPTDGTAGTQLLNEDSATSESTSLTEPRWTRFDPLTSLSLEAGGHDGSDQAVRLSTDADVDLPMGLIGADQSDMNPVTSGVPYHVEGWFKGGDATTKAGLAILWWDPAGQVHVAIDPIELDIDQDWTLHTFNAYPPPGATDTVAGVVLLGPRGSAQSVLVDDLAFCTGRVSCVPAGP